MLSDVGVRASYSSCHSAADNVPAARPASPPPAAAAAALEAPPPPPPPPAAPPPPPPPKPIPVVTAIPGNKYVAINITDPITIKPSNYTITVNPTVTGLATSYQKGTKTISNLTNGIEYTFTITANYPDNTKSSASIKATPILPPPASITAVADNASAKITITPPTVYDIPISRYIISRSNPSLFNIQMPPTPIKFLSATDPKTFTATGLTNGTSYTFSVVVVYTGDLSSISKSAWPVTPIAPLPPPTGISAVFQASKKAVITLTPPLQDKNLIDKFKIIYVKTQYQTTEYTKDNIPKNTTSYTISNLDLKHYKFKVETTYKYTNGKTATTKSEYTNPINIPR
jgi:hypothetical protein